MGSGMLSVGITGIRAAQMGMEATQHNIANANTPGYSRQYIQQSAGIPRLTGAGYFGSGTNVDTVRRAYDKYLTQQVQAAQTNASESAAQLAKLSQIDNMLGDPSSGLAPALQDFFTGVQQVAANPTLVSARQSMLASSQTMVARFNALSERLGELYDGVNGEITSELSLINIYAAQIGDVNGQITRAEAATNQPPNDLLDMRDQLVAELNKHVKVSTVEDSIGNFNVFVGNGLQLVVGNVVNSLVPVTSSLDPERIVVGFKGQSGSVQELPESLVEGGALGGLMAFRRTALDDATNTLGQIAASLALTFNAQHALGQDLQGLSATSPSGSGFQADYFDISGPKVFKGSTSASDVTAAFLKPLGGPVVGQIGALNPSANPSDYTLQKTSAGYTLTRTSDSTSWSATSILDLNAQVAGEGVTIGTGNYYSTLSGSDYKLRSDGTNLTLTRLSDNTSWTAGSVAALNTAIAGEGFSVAGTPTANVDYLIEPTRDIARNITLNPYIAGDTKRIAAAAPNTTTLATTNTGSLKVTQGQVTSGYALTGLPLTFTFNSSTGRFAFPGGATVTGTYANGSTASSTTAIARVNAGQELTRLTVNGISVDISGLPANGDTFTIAPNLNGVADSRNAVKLAALQTQSTMESGKATFQASYASLVSGVGSVTRQVKLTGESQQALLKQNELARSAVSGVNLDEEAANLIKYQQAYQASARALDISSKLFDTLLGIVN